MQTNPRNIHVSRPAAADGEDALAWVERVADLTPVGQPDGRLPDGRYPATVAVAGFDSDGAPLLRIPGLPHPVRGRSAVALDRKSCGKMAVAMAEGGDWNAPILIGIILESGTSAKAATARLEKRIAFEAEGEIVLRCGRSSLSMTRDGDIVIRGVNLLSRAAAVNKIKGGAVHLN